MPVNLKGIYIYVLSPSSLDLSHPSSLRIYGKARHPVPPLCLMEMSVVLLQPPRPHAPPPGAAAALAALAAAAAASSWAVPAADAVFGGYPFGIPFSNCERTMGNRAFLEGFFEKSCLCFIAVKKLLIPVQGQPWRPIGPKKYAHCRTWIIRGKGRGRGYTPFLTFPLTRSLP